MKIEELKKDRYFSIVEMPKPEEFAQSFGFFSDDERQKFRNVKIVKAGYGEKRIRKSLSRVGDGEKALVTPYGTVILSDKIKPNKTVLEDYLLWATRGNYFFVWDERKLKEVLFLEAFIESGNDLETFGDFKKRGEKLFREKVERTTFDTDLANTPVRRDFGAFFSIVSSDNLAAKLNKDEIQKSLHIPPFWRGVRVIERIKNMAPNSFEKLISYSEYGHSILNEVGYPKEEDISLPIRPADPLIFSKSNSRYELLMMHIMEGFYGEKGIKEVLVHPKKDVLFELIEYSLFIRAENKGGALDVHDTLDFLLKENVTKSDHMGVVLEKTGKRFSWGISRERIKAISKAKKLDKQSPLPGAGKGN